MANGGVSALLNTVGLEHRDLDLAGGDVRVRGADHLVLLLGELLAARLHDAADADHPLAAQRFGDLVRLGRGVGVEHDLRDAVAVAQIDERDRAVVAAIGHPAEQHDLLADVGGAERAAAMGSFQLVNEAGHLIFLGFGGSGVAETHRGRLF